MIPKIPETPANTGGAGTGNLTNAKTKPQIRPTNNDLRQSRNKLKIIYTSFY